MKKDPVCGMEIEETNALTLASEGTTIYFCSEGCRDKFLKERNHRTPRSTYDLLILGGGPSGLTAAVYAATLKMDAFLITRDLGGQAVDSTKIENYMGYDFITGPELIERFQGQLIHSHYVDHLLADIEKIEASNGNFQVTTNDLNLYSAKVLIVCTGMTRRRLGVPGEEEFQRKGVFYGNIQDLSFVQGKDAVVVGGGNSALQIVENLQTVAKNIHLLSNSELKADPAIIERVKNIRNLRVLEGYKTVGIRGENNLSSIVVRRMATDDTLEIPAGGVFIAIGFQANSSLVSHLVELNERREIVINHDCSTSHAGIFAAGDVTNAFGKRIIIASGEGAKAALAARQYILNLRRRQGLHDDNKGSGNSTGTVRRV